MSSLLSLKLTVLPIVHHCLFIFAFSFTKALLIISGRGLKLARGLLACHAVDGPPGPSTAPYLVPPEQTLETNPAIQTLESNPAIQTLETNPANHLYPKTQPLTPLINGGGTMHSCYGQSGGTTFRGDHL